MVGQKDLSKVLESLSVVCDGDRYGFTSVKNQAITPDDRIFGTFREDEGTTIIAKEAYFKQNHLSYEGPFAKLTINVHTSLELVGLTAVLATGLAENGISANVVAAFFHDHIFVQYKLREKAIKAIDQLKDK